MTTWEIVYRWADHQSFTCMANAVMDQLAHNAHHIVLKGESYRKKKGLKADARNTKNPTE